MKQTLGMEFLLWTCTKDDSEWFFSSISELRVSLAPEMLDFQAFACHTLLQRIHANMWWVQQHNSQAFGWFFNFHTHCQLLQKTMFVGSDANEEKVTAKPGNATWLVNKTENETFINSFFSKLWSIFDEKWKIDVFFWTCIL